MKLYVVTTFLSVVNDIALPQIRGIYTNKKNLARAVVKNESDFNFPSYFRLDRVLNRADAVEIINEYAETATIEIIETNREFRPIELFDA